MYAMKRKECNFCQEIMSLNRKHYCEDCESAMFRECRACHKPYPDQKYFKINAEKCNSCSKKKKKNHGQNEMVDNVAEGIASNVSDTEESERCSEKGEANEMHTREKATTLETIEEEIDVNDNLKEIGEGEMFPDNDTDIEEEQEQQPDLESMDTETTTTKTNKRKTSTPKKIAKKSKFSESEMASLIEEVKESDVKMIQQQRRQQAKDSEKLFQNTKTLKDVLGKAPKRGPKAGKPKTPVTDHEKSQRAFVNSLLLMKKTDPAFNFNVNLTF